MLKMITTGTRPSLTDWLLYIWSTAICDVQVCNRGHKKKKTTTTKQNKNKQTNKRKNTSRAVLADRKTEDIIRVDKK